MACSHLQTHTHTQTHVGLCGVYDSSTLQTVAEDRSSSLWVLRLVKGPNSFALLDTAHLLNSSQHLKHETDKSEAKLPVMAPWGSLLAPISASSFLHMSHSRWAAVELSHPRQVSTWLMVLGFSHRSSRQPMIRLCMFFGHTWPEKTVTPCMSSTSVQMHQRQGKGRARQRGLSTLQTQPITFFRRTSAC